MAKVKIRESEVQRQILEWLIIHGISAERINNTGVPLKGGGFRPARKKGISDIIGVIPQKGSKFGIPLYIECKSPGKKPSPEQEAYLEEKDRAGALCLVADNLDFVIRTITPYL